MYIGAILQIQVLDICYGLLLGQMLGLVVVLCPDLFTPTPLIIDAKVKKQGTGTFLFGADIL